MANHAPPADPTKTIGLPQSAGSVTLSLISASPVELATKLPVDTFLTPFGVMQLTVALKNGTGLLPLTGGTTMIKPWTLTSTCPSLCTQPCADVITHGSPPPLMPRSFTAPTAEPVTGVIESNSKNWLPPASAPTVSVPAAAR